MAKRATAFGYFQNEDIKAYKSPPILSLKFTILGYFY